MQTTALRLLKERGIEVFLDCNVVAIEERTGGVGDVVCENGTRIPYCEVIWCTNVRIRPHADCPLILLQL